MVRVEGHGGGVEIMAALHGVGFWCTVLYDDVETMTLNAARLRPMIKLAIESVQP
jgi:hypothetical protein